MKNRRPPPVRRMPAQERGQKRIDAILDATETIVAERGYDALTLSDVAERSGSAIGSLYRFFSSKEQLGEALARRISAAIDGDPASMPAVPLGALGLREFVVWYTDWMLETFRRHPALGGLLHHEGPHCEPLVASAMAPIDAYVAAHAVHVTKAQRAVVTRMALEIATSGLKLPAKAQATTEAAVTQIHFALRGYLANVLHPD